jgi:hypothetical protein
MMVFAKSGWIISSSKLNVLNIEVGSKVPVQKERFEDIEIKSVTVMLYPFSYEGPFVEGYFDLYTRDFVLKECYIYQSNNDLNNGYAELCLG